MLQVHLSQQLPMPRIQNALYPYNPSLYDELMRLFATNLSVEPIRQSFEDIMADFRSNGRDFEYCPELENGELPPVLNRRKKNRKPLPTECAFCKNNGEEIQFYKQHILKDLNGRTACPILRRYTCPICGANGDTAHTIKYCPANKSPEPIPLSNAMKRQVRNSAGKTRSNRPISFDPITPRSRRLNKPPMTSPPSHVDPKPSGLLGTSLLPAVWNKVNKDAIYFRD